MSETRKVKLRVSFTTVEPVPADWDRDMILFYFNDSLSCLNNRLSLEHDDDDCCCAEGAVELLEDPAEEP